MSCDPFLQNHKRVVAGALLGLYGDLDDNNIFLSIGRVEPWVTDLAPPQNVDSESGEIDFKRRAFAYNAVSRDDVSLVVRRYDWVGNAVYDAYRDDVDLYDDVNPSKFYVLVDEERVYKCIDNNNGGQSLYAPTHTDAEIRRLPDGYRWKFLYQIPESKRKFLTKTQGDSIGYMPVEFIERLNQNDERYLQWNIQQAAVNGEISHIRLDSDIKPFSYGVNCLYPSNQNDIVGGFSAGATSVNISSPFLIINEGYYDNMVLSIDSGLGQGQRRRILDYRGLTTFSTVDLDYPLSSPLAAGSSKFSIQPNIRVSGDGSQNNSQYNPYARSAEVTVRFGGTSDVAPTGASCDSFGEFRAVDSFELVDGGKDYSFADLTVIKGLAVPPSKTALDINNLGIPVISPRGGHGSNPVLELGASSIMIVKDFDRDERGQISTDNDFRQVGIVVNPLLEEKQVRLRFYQVGLSGSFNVGTTAGQTGHGFDKAYGTVVSWYPGVTGHTGISELVLTNIRDGNFKAKGTVSTFTVYDVDERIVAGSENRRLLKMELLPLYDSFSVDADDFYRGLVAQGVGDRNNSVLPSRASGDIYAWEPDLGTNRLGYLYLENVNGRFKTGEIVSQVDRHLNYFTDGLSGIGKVSSIYTEIRGKSVYDQSTSLVVSKASAFSETEFVEDEIVQFALGLTGAATGYVMSWKATGTTGHLRLTGTNGKFLDGMSCTGTHVGTQVSGILKRSEIKYGSGDILYIQNVRPIQRRFDQREEFKIVIDF